MDSKTKVLGTLLVVFALAVAGCGSTPISVMLSLTGTQNVVAGQALNVTATVAHDGQSKGVTWSLTGPGTLSAQTTTSVTYTAPSPIASNGTATITATSVSNSMKVATLTINLQAVTISLTPSAAQTLEQTQTVSVTATISNDPSTTPTVTWSLSTGAKGTLSGQTATGVTYHAPASVTAASTDTITATSKFDNTKTQTLTINLVPPPSITPTTLPAGTVGVAYTTTNLAATGGVSPYTWTVTSAAATFPAGLTLSSGGAISGTPTQFGTFDFTVQAKDASNFTATATLSIKVNPAPVMVTTTSLPNGVANQAGYSATLQATGGAPPITWAVTTGSLPTGLALNTATGAITGMPTTAGIVSFTVTASDSSAPALTNSKALSITIIPQLKITTTSPLPNGITNTAYTGVTLASTGGSGAVVWTLSGGTTLPPNLSLNASTGAITGTPTTAGAFSFTVQAADSGTPQQKVTQSFTITIIQQLVITTPAALPTGTVGQGPPGAFYGVQLASNGGTGAVTWALASGSTLPGGLTLTATGQLGGTPTTAGTFHFSITATDSGTPQQQTATVAFTLTITPMLAITTTQAQIPSGTVNTAYSTTIMSNNGGIAPYTWFWTPQTGSSLPPGLNINSSTGVISGTPTTAGTYKVFVDVSDSEPNPELSAVLFSISIATAPLSVATTSLPDAIIGRSYNQTLTSAGGNPPVTWSISAGALPTWATLNTSTGAITGPAATATGTTTFTVKATDSSAPTAQTATKQLSITAVGALSITTASLPAGIVGTAYPNTTVSATGGTTPYTWSWTGQPPGLSIDSTTGVISGTPTTNTGSPFNVTVTVKDSATNPQQTASANFTITVTVATLVVTTTSGQLPTGTVSSAYPNTQLSASGGISPYTWAVTGGALPTSMMMSTAGVISGTPTATGTFNFTVTVTDSETPAKTANANLSITVNAAGACTTGGSESLFNGGYAFLLKSFESSGNPALVGGVITVDGAGHVTAGTMDMNLSSGVQTAINVSSGCFSVGSDHRGFMSLTTNSATNATQTFRFSLGGLSGNPAVASTGHMINFDSGGPFTTGVLRKQSSGTFSNSSVTGSFAFGASSLQTNTVCAFAVCGGKFGIVGYIVFNGAGGISGGSEDINQNGFLDGSQTAAAYPATSPINFNSTGSSYTLASNGRGTLTISINAGGTTITSNAFLYAVSSTEALFMTKDSQTTTTVVAGQALQQSGTPFALYPLSGTYVGYDSGTGPSTGTTTRADLYFVGPFTSGSPNVSLTQYRNDGGTFTSGTQSGGSYSTSATGRALVNTGNHSPVVYLVSPNEAFVLTGNGRVDTGFFQSQTGTTASGTYAFGSIDPEGINIGGNSGVVTLTSGNITGASDNNSSGGQQVNQPITTTYSVDANGVGHIPANCTISATSTTCQLMFLVVSPTKAFLTELQHSGGTAQTSPAIMPTDQ